MIGAFVVVVVACSFAKWKIDITWLDRRLEPPTERESYPLNDVRRNHSFIMQVSLFHNFQLQSAELGLSNKEKNCVTKTEFSFFGYCFRVHRILLKMND